MKRTTGQTWEPSPDEVLNPRNGRKYDCEFTSSGSRPIAADVFGLYPLGSDLRTQGARHRIIDKLTSALGEENIGGLHIQTPVPEKKHVDPRWYKVTARRVREFVAGNPDVQTFEIDGMHCRWYGQPDQPVSFAHGWTSMYQPIEAAGYPLAKVLRDKTDQIDVSDHDRFLLGTLSSMPVNVEDVIEACAFIDFNEYQTTDRIYFHSAGDDFRLIYSRRAWEMMERAKLPSCDDERSLVTTWIELRMGFHWRSGLESALRISWDEGGREWLSVGGSELLDLESHLFLQDCEWTTPRAYWEIHRGPLPVVGDGRRRMNTIRG